MIRISFSSPFWLGLRRLLRRFRITGLASQLIRRAEYEEQFSRALLDGIQSDDCVWDVGANFGHYTSMMADRVGANGKVVAFEPAPETFAALASAAECGGWTNVILQNVALSGSTRELLFVLTGEAGGVTNHVSAQEPMTNEQTLVRVQASSADDFLAREPDLAPNIIKIDVEGHEDEVIRGMKRCLALPALRSIFLEMHFSALDHKGARHAPRTIVENLEQSGFHVQWLDASHLFAERKVASP